MLSGQAVHQSQLVLQNWLAQKYMWQSRPQLLAWYDFTLQCRSLLFGSGPLILSATRLPLMGLTTCWFRIGTAHDLSTNCSTCCPHIHTSRPARSIYAILHGRDAALDTRQSLEKVSSNT